MNVDKLNSDFKKMEKAGENDGFGLLGKNQINENGKQGLVKSQKLKFEL